MMAEEDGRRPHRESGQTFSSASFFFAASLDDDVEAEAIRLFQFDAVEDIYTQPDLLEPLVPAQVIITNGD